MREETGTRKRRRPTRTRRSTRRSALWARPKTEITDEQYDEFYKHVAHDFEAPLAQCTHNASRAAGVHAAPLRPGARAVRPVGPRASPRRSSSTCGACSSWTTPSSCCRAYLRFVRGVVDSNDLPLNVSREILQAVARRRDDPRRLRQARARRCSRTSPRTSKEKYATFWKRVRPRAEGRPGRGPRQPRAHREAAALRLDARRTRDDAGRVARRLRRAHEGRPGQDLLRHRRHLRRGRETARTSRSSARRASRCCCWPTASTSGWSRNLHGVRGQAAGVGGARRARPGQARRRGGEEGRREAAEVKRELLERSSRRRSASG